MAFNKVYVFYLRKSPNLTSVIYFLLIVVLNVPLRSLKLIYFLMIKNKKSIKEGLIELCVLEHHILKSRKIEVYNSRVYLNCFTKRMFLDETCKAFGVGPNKVLPIAMKIMGKINYFHAKESKNQKMIEFPFGRIYDEDGSLVISGHYINKDGKSTLHPTSNKLFTQTEKQTIYGPMASAIKHGSKNPGTVLTENVGKIETSPRRLWVPEQEVALVKRHRPELFSPSEEVEKLLVEKEIAFEEVLNEISCSEDVKFVPKCEDAYFYNLIANYYGLPLQYEDESTIFKELLKMSSHE